MFYGADGELAGFSNTSVLNVEVDGRTLAVFSAGVYVRLAYQGGEASARFGLIEALRQKLRAPHIPLSYMAMASSPAPYHLYATTMPQLWPVAHEAPPVEVERAIRAVSELRKLVAVDGDAWRVKTYVKPDDPDRIRRSARLRNHPNMGFYEARNPARDHAEAATALLVWIPLDARNIAGAALRLISGSRR